MRERSFPDEGSVDDVIARAVDDLRSTPSRADWGDLSSAVAARISRTARRSRPVDATFAPGTDPRRAADTLRIGDRVVRTAIRRAVDETRYEVIAVDLHLDGTMCTGATMHVVGSYGDDLRSVGAVLGARATAALTETLGPGDRRVEVHFDDLTRP